jgi:hypothetical protein
MATLTGNRIRDGVWEGLLMGQAEQPTLQVLHQDAPINGMTVSAVAGQPGHWAVRVPIPAQTVSEGVQTFVIRDQISSQTLAHFTVIASFDDTDDIRAEIGLLRAELDMLKRAFRRHCVETAS